MQRTQQSDITQTIDERGFLSQIDDISIRELSEALEETGHRDLRDIVAIALFVHKLLIGKGMVGSEKSSKDRVIDSIVKYDLSADEIRTLRLMADGNTNNEMADKLAISIEGVKKRVERILAKLNVSNRIQAAVKAAKESLV